MNEKLNEMFPHGYVIIYTNEENTLKFYYYDAGNENSPLMPYIRGLTGIYQ